MMSASLTPFDRPRGGVASTVDDDSTFLGVLFDAKWRVLVILGVGIVNVFV